MPLEKPKYVLIADHLLREIRDGTHPLGDLLPTETALMRTFDVSRHTVRFAVQELKKRGVVASRQGQGSKVVSTQPDSSFVETIQSIDELIAFGQETTRELMSHHIVEANAELAQLFNCSVGRHLAEAHMLRKTLGPKPSTIAHVTLWMDALIEPVIHDLDTIRKSAAEIIADRYGYIAKSVTQTVSADVFGEEDARTLDIPSGSPALIIERRYCTAQANKPYLVARSRCRADKMKLASTFLSST